MSSMNTVITWVRDDTIRITAVVKDFDGRLFAPTSDKITIYDPFGTNMGTLTSNLVGSGTYKVDYVIPAGGTAGDWRCSWQVYSGTYPAREIIRFKVAEG